MDSNNAASTDNDNPNQSLNEIITSTENTLSLLNHLYLTVSSFNCSYQLPLLHRLNSLVSELENMSRLSNECNIQVPVEVLNLLDEGKNPDEFTRDAFNACIAKNQVIAGKTEYCKSLRKHLLEELEQAFPDVVEAYKEIRASSAMEAKRLANGDLKVKNEP